MALGEPAQSEGGGGGGEGGDISVKECESGNYSVGTKNLDHYELH